MRGKTKNTTHKQTSILWDQSSVIEQDLQQKNFFPSGIHKVVIAKKKYKKI